MRSASGVEAFSACETMWKYTRGSATEHGEARVVCVAAICYDDAATACDSQPILLGGPYANLASSCRSVDTRDDVRRRRLSERGRSGPDAHAPAKRRCHSP